MNASRRTKTPNLSILAATLLASAFCSCVASQPYVNTNIANPVELRDSPAHAFTYVNVTEDDGQLVVFGKVRHHHVACASAAHVDLAAIGTDGRATHQISIPMQRRNSRARGWYGAAFRARLPLRIPPDQVIRLAFHDQQCVATQTYDCRENQALGRTGR